MSATEEGLVIKLPAFKAVCAWCEKNSIFKEHVTHTICDKHAAQFEKESREYLAKLKGEK